MVKTFTVWMEDKMQEKRLTKALLRNLGYDSHALEDQDVVLNDRKFDDIKGAIERLAIDDDNKSDMVNFVQNHRKADGSIQNLSLKALAAKINPLDAETQDTLSSSPAQLPPGNQPVPKPMNPQQQMMQQQNQPPMAAGMGQMGY
jgi:hypothetical protein